MWIRRLLEVFLLCQEEFRVLAPEARRRGMLPAQAERLVAEFGERAVKALDVCNAARDGIVQVLRWEPLANFAASLLRGPWRPTRASCDTPAQGLIGLIGYSYQQVATSFPGADLERTLKLSVIGLEQFRDG